LDRKTRFFTSRLRNRSGVKITSSLMRGSLRRPCARPPAAARG
jgi:hypothetical protein